MTDHEQIPATDLIYQRDSAMRRVDAVIVAVDQESRSIALDPNTSRGVNPAAATGSTCASEPGSCTMAGGVACGGAIEGDRKVQDWALPGVKRRDDDSGSGAKYSAIHVGRSCFHAWDLLPSFGFSRDELRQIQNAICATAINGMAAKFRTRPAKVTRANNVAPIGRSAASAAAVGGLAMLTVPAKTGLPISQQGRIIAFGRWRQKAA
jgi:hypothetical protein